jgi:hypothetical protein
MFSQPRVNVIDSDEGYSIESHGMTDLEYREGDNSVFMLAYVGPKGLSREIVRDTIRYWSSQKGSRPVTEDERMKILE